MLCPYGWERTMLIVKGEILERHRDEEREPQKASNLEFDFETVHKPLCKNRQFRQVYHSFTIHHRHNFTGILIDRVIEMFRKPAIVFLQDDLTFFYISIVTIHFDSISWILCLYRLIESR